MITKFANVVRGITPIWVEEGTLLGPGEEAILVNVANKSGRLISARLFSKYVDGCLTIIADGASICAWYSNWINAHYMGYGCTGRGGIMNLKRFDTVSNKYILELEFPVEYGQSLVVRLQNITGIAQRCCGDAVWTEN